MPEGESIAARNHVSDFRAYHVARLAQFDAVETRIRRDYADRAELPYWLLTLSYGQHVSRALLDWCDEADRTVRAAASPGRRALARRKRASTR